jgi:hypothetical protein
MRFRLCCTALAGLLLALAGSMAHADADLPTEGLFTGTVGPYPIVLEFTGPDASYDESVARYFYRKFKQDIPLKRVEDADGIELSSEASGDKLSLVKSGKGYRGTLLTAKGKRLAVTLSPVKSAVAAPVPGLEYPDNKSWSDYDKLKLADVQFLPGKKETVGGRVVQSYSEPLSRISLFRVLEGYPEPVLKAVNTSLERDFYQSLQLYFFCTASEGEGSGAQIELASRYLGDRFISYAISTFLECREYSHPGHNVDGATFDARSGRGLSFQDIWYPPAASGAARSRTGEEQDIAEALVALFKKLYPDQMSADSDACDYTDSGVWVTADLDWYLNDKGLVVRPFFSEVARPCNDTDWSIVPYAELKKRNPALFAN